jgi:hypothetical protein
MGELSRYSGMYQKRSSYFSSKARRKCPPSFPLGELAFTEKLVITHVLPKCSSINKRSTGNNSVQKSSDLIDVNYTSKSGDFAWRTYNQNQISFHFLSHIIATEKVDQDFS